MFSQEAASEPEELREIPERFFQIQDARGFFWQASGNGALTSGETQYLQSGVKLIVAGDSFAPAEGTVREPASGSDTVDLALEEKRSGYSIRRDLWFDTERAGVRVFDTLTSTDSVAQTISVELRTTYPFGWQSLHGTDGALLSNEPSLLLGERDTGVVVRFSPSEGRHDTLFLVSSEDGGQKPKLKASSNSRELTFTYDLILKPGESKSLFHWILQRNVPELSESGADLGEFVQRGRLVRPGIEASRYANVANFGAEAFPDEATAPSGLRSLVSLNSLTDRIGFHRRSEDLLWISTSNQISGKVDRDATLKVQAAYLGEQEIPVRQVAAIKGGAGAGRTPKVFLRDGRVLVGPIEAPGLVMATGEDDAELDPERINLLLLGTGPDDGAAPEGTSSFLELKDGSVMALSTEQDVELSIATAWGMDKVELSEILEIGYLTEPHPRWRLAAEDGSRFSVFLPGAILALKTAGGSEFEVPTVAIQRLWRPGAGAPTIRGAADSWFDFSEIPEGPAPESGFLLAGNNLLRGGIGDAYLTLMHDGSNTRIAGDRISAIRRRIDGEPDAGPPFEIELDNGDRLEGTFGASYFTLQGRNGPVRLPVEYLLAFRSSSS